MKKTPVYSISQLIKHILCSYRGITKEEEQLDKKNSSSQQRETRFGCIVCVVASISAAMNLTYKAGDDRLIGIKKISGNCIEYVMYVLE
jgi:hypothetical protein